MLSVFAIEANEADVELKAYEALVEPDAYEALNTVIDDVCEVSIYGANIDAVVDVSTYSGAEAAVCENEALVELEA